LSYKSVYAFHIVLIINILWWAAYAVKERRDFVNLIRSAIQPTKTIAYLSVFWLAAPFWFAFEMLYCESKMAALQHLIILSFGASLVGLSILNLKTLDDFKQIFRLTAIVGGLNIAIGLAESAGIFRYPIGSLSRINSVFGYKDEFWNGLTTAFHGSLISPSPSLNYEATLAGAYTRISTIPTGWQWNPNDYALFLLLLFPFFIFTKNKIAHIIGIFSIFLLTVMAGGRLVFIGLVVATLAAAVSYSLSKAPSLTKAIRPMLLPVLLSLFIATNGFTLAGKYFWQSNEMAFLYKKEMPQKSTNLLSQKIATNSINVRKSLTIAGFSTLKKQYGIGVGGGNMAVLLQQKGGIGASHITKLHNFWLELLVEGGVLFAMAFGLWFAFLLKFLYKIIQKNTTKSTMYYYAISTFIALIGLIIGGIAPSSLLYYLPMYALFGWSLALVRLGFN
jgi:teichuronic acid biosynthesis protein TuaE